MAEWVIEPLQAKHNRAEFCCGNAQLDSFIRTLASQYERKRLGRTFVATTVDSPQVAGYYTLATGSIELDTLPAAVQKKLPRHPIPTIHLGRLAVDQTFRGRRLGLALLMHALRAAFELSQIVGVYAVDVWAIDDQARAFYEKYQFTSLEDDPNHMYLTMKTIEQVSNAVDNPNNM